MSDEYPHLPETKTIVVENTSWNTEGYLAGYQAIYWHEPPNYSCFQTMPKMEYAIKPGDHVTFYYGPILGSGQGATREFLSLRINDGPMISSRLHL